MITTNSSSLSVFDLPPNGTILFYQNFIDKNKDVMTQLLETCSLEQETLNFSGKETKMPRLVAWYGDEGKKYTYSRKTFSPKSWTKELLEIKEEIEKIEPSIKYNSCLINYYRDGNDSIGFHSDDEPGLGVNPTIASVSLGGWRTFHMKRNLFKEKLKLELGGGDLLIMKGDIQHNWKHGINKFGTNTLAALGVAPRLNLTFRNVNEE